MRNLSLFTGSGIGDWAAKQAGIETVAQCENDPCCLYCLKKLWPDAEHFDDIRSLSTAAIRKLGPIDIISGGFPCQDLSTAGRGAGIEGSRSGLWREMFRVIRTARPAWCLIENVPAIRVRGVDRVIAPLERIGYTCWPLVVGAEHVGAPHKRHRVWIVAHAEENRRGQVEWVSHSGRCQLGGIDGASEGKPDDADSARRGTRCAIGEACEGPEALGAVSAIRREGELADRSRQCGKQRPERDGVGIFRWPSRPGEPQHGWEWKRLLRTDRPYPPKPGDPEYSRVLERALGDATDGVARRLRSRTNKSLLRMAGNGWVPQIPYLIYHWIVETERGTEPNDAAQT